MSERKAVPYKVIIATAVITSIIGLGFSSLTKKENKLENAAPKSYVDDKALECHEYIDFRFKEHEKSDLIADEAVQRQLNNIQGDLTIIKNHILNGQ